MRAALLGLLVLAGAAAGAGEEPPAIDDVRLAELPLATVRSDLVAVVRISTIVDLKDAKEGAGKGYITTDPNEGFARSLTGGEPTVRLVSAEVVEVLKGGGPAKALNFPVVTGKVKLGKAPPAEVVAVQDWYQRGKYGTRRARALTYARYRLAKDQKLLVFLREIATVEEGGKVAERQYALTDPSVGGAPEKAVEAVKKTLKEIADWEKPPKLPAEEHSAMKKLVNELGSPDFRTREAATAALIAKGLAAKGPADEALKSSDPEVKQRAGTILEAIKPAVLKAKATEDGDEGLD